MINRVTGAVTKGKKPISEVLEKWFQTATDEEVAWVKGILGLDHGSKLGRETYHGQDPFFEKKWEENFDLGIPMPPKPNGSRSSPSQRLLIHLNGRIVGSVIWVHGKNDVWVMFY